MRTVNILPALHEELTSYRTKLTSSDAALVFGKSPSHFRVSYAPHAARVLAADTPGTTCVNVNRLQFRNVSDHLQAVIDHVESYDRLLTDVLGAHLAQITVQQNTDMRRISAWVAIAAVPTMIAGIYGMNFDFMPELTASLHVGGGEFRYGYFVVLGLMAVVCGALYRAFKRSGWL